MQLPIIPSCADLKIILISNANWRHQIRVHMASIGHPILGDSMYGPSKCPFKLQGQTLHAKVLGITHPSTGKYIEVDAPLPEYFNKLLKQLEER